MSELTTQQPAEGVREYVPGGPRTMDEAFKDFRSSVEVQSSEGKQGAHLPERNDADLKKLTPEQLEKWNKSGELPGDKEEKKESAEQPATEAERDSKPTSKTKADERQSEQLTPFDRLLQRASQEPHFEEIVERFNEPFFPISAEGTARYQVLGHALRQVSNPDDVVYYIAHPDNSSIALKMQDATPQKIAQMVHTISAQLRFGGNTTKKVEDRPRAPKPPSEVGGRSSFSGDPLKEAVRNNDFATAESIWNRGMRQRD